MQKSTPRFVLLAVIIGLSMNQCSRNSLSPESGSGEALPVNTVMTNPQKFDAIPVPVGGDAALERKIAGLSELAGLQNRIELLNGLTLSVLVTEDGKVQQIKTLRSRPEAPEDIIPAIIETVKSFSWKPAEINGSRVQAWRWLSFRFQQSPEQASGITVKIQENSKIIGNVFVAYDQAPQPVGGIAAIQKNLVFPESARKAGFSGKTIVNVLIDVDGKALDTRILKSSGNAECDQAASEALKATRWQPATQRGKPVRVWVGFPVLFHSSTSTKTGTGKQSSTQANAEYDVPPQPVGGADAFVKAVVFPESARKDGFSGITILNIRVDEQGTVQETRILKSSGNEECDQAARDAAYAVSWKSARKDDKPVSAWVAMPVVFRTK